MKIFGAVFLGLLAACSSPGNQLESRDFNDLPSVGEISTGEQILLGGFSGLACRNFDAAEQEWVFFTLTDRGPNGDSNHQGRRPFLWPAFVPRIVEFGWSPKKRTLRLRRELPMRTVQGKALTGLPNLPTDEVPVDAAGKVLAIDPLGVDSEGIALGEHGTFWVSEEYRPAILEFDAEGKLRSRWVPEGQLAKRYSETRAQLPSSFSRRLPNRGFEGITIAGSMLYAFLQSPLDKTRHAPVLEFDLDHKRSVGVRSYAFQGRKADKIGDVAALRDGSVLVLEQDGKSERAIFRWWPDGGATQLVADLQVFPELAALEKIEGLAVMDSRTLALINDNDFGMAGPATSQFFVLKLAKALPAKTCGD